MRFQARIRRISAISAAALFLTWPALLNRYPLLYPDSISYLQDGRPVADAILHHTSVNAMRSELYALGILPFHWNLTPWPIVALNALLTAWILSLVLASALPAATRRPAGRNLQTATYLAITGALSLLTSASWYVSLPMPDILGPLLYLALYLLVFANETLSRAQSIALSLLAIWAITAHATHLMLAIGVVLLLALLHLVRWPPLLHRGRAVTHVALLIVIAATAQLALHTWLNGRPSLLGNHPPYLMARIVADGPGALYLQQNCPHLSWAICADVNHLPNNDDDFLWGDPGIWSSASPDTQQRLLAEEMPLVLATLRAYPRRQLAVSWENFTRQLNDFGVDDFDNNEWMASALETVIPGAQTRYARTLQARSAIPTNAFTLMQRWIVIPSALLLAALLPWLWRHSPRLLGLTAIVVPTLFVNAFVTAVLSSSDARYQSRIIWLIPFTATLAVIQFLQTRRLAHLPPVAKSTRVP